MSITQTLFDRWKAARGITSNREAMRVLGLSPTANIHWKAGRNADADVIERMANDIGENAGELIAQAMAEQAKGEAAKTWARLAKQLGAAAAVVLAVALPYDAKAATAPQAEPESAMYIMRNRLRRLAAWIATMGRRLGGCHASPVLA